VQDLRRHKGDGADAEQAPTRPVAALNQGGQRQGQGHHQQVVGGEQ
jgi:hypothetical protein